MASFPPSGELFFSSPQRELRSGPGDEVLLLVARAQLTKVLPQPIASFLAASPEQISLFKQVFSRQIELLKSRSQAFEDRQITVYDKTLLTLTRNGNDLNSPAAIAYFCEEYLGIKKTSNHTTTQRILQQSVTLPALLAQELSPAATVKIEPSIERATPASSPQMEPKLARLWSVYKQAKDDFTEAKSMSDTFKTAAAVKFLRDTAENTLQYLQNKNTDPNMMAELEATYSMAKTTAVSLTGGKKRKFDVPDAERINGTPRGPSQLASKRCQGDRNSEGSYDGGYAGGRGYDVAPRMRGRGHSGVPFGYTRSVDSYQPY